MLTITRKMLVPGDCQTFDINKSFDSAEKMFGINISKAIAKFCLSLRYYACTSYLVDNGQEIFNFKVDN